MWWVSHAIGYFVAVIVAAPLIKQVVDRLYETPVVGRSHETIGGERAYAWMAVGVGLVERLLYVAALQIGKGEFIGVWLALKAAGQWEVWREPTPEARATYQIFLIGSALSVLYAGVGFKIIGWVLDGEWLRAMLGFLFVIAVPAGLRMWMCVSQD
jgi:hypothetical protein